MISSPASELGVEPPITAAGNAFSRLVDSRVVQPLLHLLRVGASPRHLAWSLAVGVAVGINPIVGSTTLVCLVVAVAFRLNLIASQIANHLAFPIQLALVLFYLRAGEILFRTGPMPMAGEAYLHDLRHHPWRTAHLLWAWEWHAIVVWLLAVAVLTPLLATTLHPILNRLLARIHREPVRS